MKKIFAITTTISVLVTSLSFADSKQSAKKSLAQSASDVTVYLSVLPAIAAVETSNLTTRITNLTIKPNYCKDILEIASDDVTQLRLTGETTEFLQQLINKMAKKSGDSVENIRRSLLSDDGSIGD